MVGDLRWRSCITGFKCGKGEGERDVSFDCVPTAKAKVLNENTKKVKIQVYPYISLILPLKMESEY